MPIRVSGLNSGLDTDSIVKELVSAYRTKGDKLKKQQTKLSWTQDKWKSLNAKVLSLYKSLDSLRFASGYNMKKTTVSDMTKATVTAGKNAINGTQKLKISEVANSGYLTGAKLNASKGASTKISELLNNGNGGSFGLGAGEEVEIRLTGNGKDTYLKINDNTTISDFVKQINGSETGVQASYDEVNQRLFIVSKETGREHDFMMAATDTKGASALYALGVSTQSATGSAEAKSWIETYSSGGGVNKNALIRDVKAAATAKKHKEEAEAEKVRLQNENADREAAVKYITAKKDKEAIEGKAASAADIDIITQLANMSTADREKEYEADSNGKLKLDADGKLIEASTSSVNKKKGTDVLTNDYSITSDEEIKQAQNYKKNVDVVNNTSVNNSSYLNTDLTEHNKLINQNKILIEQQDEIIAADTKNIQNYKTIDNTELTSALAALNSGDSAFDNYVNKLVKKVDYFIKSYSETSPGSGKYELNKDIVNKGAHKENGVDAEITLNGAVFTSSSNTFNINGLTIQAQAKTTEDITVTTATDSQGLYDKIKDFISEYNSIINEMSSLYNAESAKGYEPLTSEEKEALSESDIAEWEKKIKDSLLRRDGNLSTLMGVMTSAMSATYQINGKTYSLASLGIKTGSYFTTTAANRYELHIDGDADDDTTSANADQLMAMLNSDPDTVIGIIQGAASKLYEDLGKQMKTSSLRSFQSIYNDKAMAQSYSDYTKKISAWEEKVTAMEESYYKKFAAMETALAKLQSQQSAFAGMLGQ